MGEHDQQGARRKDAHRTFRARTLLYAAVAAAALACGRTEPPTPSPPDSPPKPKVSDGKMLRSGMQPAVFSYTAHKRLPPGHGVLPGPVTGQRLRT